MSTSLLLTPLSHIHTTATTADTLAKLAGVRAVVVSTVEAESCGRVGIRTLGPLGAVVTMDAVPVEALSLDRARSPRKTQTQMPQAKAQVAALDSLPSDVDMPSPALGVPPLRTANTKAVSAPRASTSATQAIVPKNASKNAPTIGAGVGADAEVQTRPAAKKRRQQPSAALRGESSSAHRVRVSPSTAAHSRAVRCLADSTREVEELYMRQLLAPVPTSPLLLSSPIDVDAVGEDEGRNDGDVVLPSIRASVRAPPVPTPAPVLAPAPAPAPTQSGQPRELFFDDVGASFQLGPQGPPPGSPQHGHKNGSPHGKPGHLKKAAAPKLRPRTASNSNANNNANKAHRPQSANANISNNHYSDGKVHKVAPMLDDSEHGYSYEMQATKAGRRAVEEKFAKINGKGAFHAGKCVFSVYIHMCVLICVFSSLAHTHTNPLLQRPTLPPQVALPAML